MEGIEKITAKILSDAQADIDQLNAQTQEKADAIADRPGPRRTKRPPTSWPGGRRPPTTGLERLSSAAQMEKRKLALAAKQEVLGEAFDLALDKLCSLPEEEYIALLTRLAVEASETGKEQLVFSETDRARVGKQVVIAANECLVKGVAPELPGALADTKVGALLGKVVNSTAAMVTGTGLLTLAQETRKMRGGFVMLDGDVEINCAFETLVRLQREKLEKQVAQVLFPE